MHRLLVPLLLFAISLGTSASSSAAVPHVDTSFGKNGSVPIPTTISRNTEDFATSLAVQSDGKVLTAVYEDGLLGSEEPDHTPVERFSTVTRFNRDGTRDRSFGRSGFVHVTWGLKRSGAVWPMEILVRPDHTIAVVGVETSKRAKGVPYGTVIVALLRPNGSAVKSFGTLGFTSPAAKIGRYGPLEFAVDSRNRLTVTSTTSSGAGFRTVRLHPNGRIDRRFGKRGVRTTMVSTRRSDSISSLRRVGGELLVVGGRLSTHPARTVTCFAARVTSRGRLDRSFGESGLAFGPTVKDTWLSGCGDGVVLAGKRVALLQAEEDGRPQLIGFTPSGLIDPTFGLSGYARIGSSLRDGTVLLQLADGRLELFGTKGQTDDDYTTTIVILDANGNPDESTGADGIAVLRKQSPIAVAMFRNSIYVLTGGEKLENGPYSVLLKLAMR